MVSSCDSEIIELWLAQQASPHTQSCYRRDAARLRAHVRKSLNQITLGDLQRFAQDLIAAGLAPVSRVRTLAAIRSLFGFCHRVRYLPTNAAAELTLPCYEQRLAERIVSEDDVSRLLEISAKTRDFVLIRLLYGAGLRVSEACGLLWRNVRPRGDAGQITVFGKNGRTRAIVLTPALWSELTVMRGSASQEDPVFPSRSGRRLDRGRIRLIVRRAAERAGIQERISPHWLRHAHASHALDHGAPIHLVQATLGHASVATTSSYLHARPGDSSARFVGRERVSPEPHRIALPLSPIGVMNVVTAKHKRPKENTFMATFTIDCENNIAAHAAVPSNLDDVQAFASEKELAKLAAEWPGSRLVEIWNSFAGVAPFTELKPVKKFTDRKAAVARIWTAVQRLSPGVTQQASDVAPDQPKSIKSAAKDSGRATARKAAKTTNERSNKKAEVLAMIKKPSGATLAEIMEATGWQAHTVRGFISLLGSKGGVNVDSLKSAEGERTYRVAK